MKAVKRILTGLQLTATTLLLVACPTAEIANGPPSAGAGETPSSVAVCLGGDGFAAEGNLQVREAAPGDARSLGAMRWQAHEGCERFVMDLLAADGTPAGEPGKVAAELLREIGVVRVALLDVGSVEPAATEAPLGGSLASAAFAVSAPEGRWIQVDVHLAGAAEARVSTLSAPARVVVDLRPGGAPVPAPAPRRNLVVVLEPRPGAAAYPLTVTGYARTFEANVVVRLEREGRQVFEDFTTATAWVDAWGHYSLTIPRGPGGHLVLHVGDYSARDGAWEGVAIELDMR
jgi:hypothetical protein